MPTLCPYNQFVDASGNPLAGGKVYTYVTGTTTNKDTYRDSKGEVKHTNPIILGDDGLPPGGAIWLDTDSAYTLDVDDSADGNILDVDNIIGIPSGYKLEEDIVLGSSASIVSSSNGDINITPGISGSITLDGLKFPTSDGDANNGILTDGSGVLTIGGTGNIGLATDASPQLGGNLDTVTYNIITSHNGAVIDDNDNTLLGFSTLPGAVNYLTFAGSATIQDPTISAAGDDTNIDLSLQPKGSGNVVISGIKYPNTDGAADYILSTDGMGNLTWFSETEMYSSAYASQSEVKAATETGKVIEPALLQHHPGVAKAFLEYSRTAGIQASHNVSSVSYSLNVLTVNWDTPFANANYAVVVMAYPSGGDGYIPQVRSKTSSSTTFTVWRIGSGVTPSGWGSLSIQVFGEQ